MIVVSTHRSGISPEWASGTGNPQMPRFSAVQTQMLMDASLPFLSGEMGDTDLHGLCSGSLWVMGRGRAGRRVHRERIKLSMWMVSSMNCSKGSPLVTAGQFRLKLLVKSFSVEQFKGVVLPPV